MGIRDSQTYDMLHAVKMGYLAIEIRILVFFFQMKFLKQKTDKSLHGTFSRFHVAH